MLYKQADDHSSVPLSKSSGQLLSIFAPGLGGSEKLMNLLASSPDGWGSNYLALHDQEQLCKNITLWDAPNVDRQCITDL